MAGKAGDKVTWEKRGIVLGLNGMSNEDGHEGVENGCWHGCRDFNVLFFNPGKRIRHREIQGASWAV